MPKSSKVRNSANKVQKAPDLHPKASGPAIRCAFTRLEDPASLKPNPKNPNKHSVEQLAMYAKVILHQGFRRSIVVSNQTGLVVTGHGALATALKRGWQKVPVDYQDFASPQDELAHLLADNKLPQLSELNEEEARAIEKDLADEGFDLELTGMDLSEIEKFRTSADVGDQPKETVVIPESWKVLVTCKTEDEQAALLQTLEKKGFECQALIS